MILTIASGKGGTGKTTVAVNLAYALARRGDAVRLLDCDVEEPNDHLFVNPTFTQRTTVETPKPIWDATKCVGCGKCAEACNYNALALVKGKVLIFNELCHSCGVCVHVCPKGAMSERPSAIGEVSVAEGNDPFFFAHGTLNIGEALAPSVVRAVKKNVSPQAINILDASPGTACPVVEAVSDSDAVLLVTEPTPFGLNDLKLAVGLTLKMGAPTGIVINRSDGEDALIADYAASVGLPIAARVPFNRSYAESYSRGEILVERFPELETILLNMFDHLQTAKPPTPEPERFEKPVFDAPPFSQGDADDYVELTIISGKGGTGKTTVVGSLARLADDKVLADNDVDAADLHLLLAPTVIEEHEFHGGVKAQVNPNKCVGCGQCAEACHFDAIHRDGPGNGMLDVTFRVDPLACEGCGLCPMVCPVDAIDSSLNLTGHWYVSATDSGPMAHAKLGVAEENSGRLVARVRDTAAELVKTLRKPTLLGDGPPGTGCPVIASVSGTDLALIVTEPTVSGAHDLERALKLTNHFGVRSLVVVNKADLNAEQVRRIETIADAHGTRVIAKIPFDREVNDALMAGKTVIDHGDGEAAQAIKKVWKVLREELTAIRSPGNENE